MCIGHARRVHHERAEATEVPRRFQYLQTGAAMQVIEQGRRITDVHVEDIAIEPLLNRAPRTGQIRYSRQERATWSQQIAERLDDLRALLKMLHQPKAEDEIISSPRYNRPIEQIAEEQFSVESLQP